MRLPIRVPRRRRCSKPTRVGFSFREDGTKVRIAKKSGAEIPRPDILTQRSSYLKTGA